MRTLGTCEGPNTSEGREGPTGAVPVYHMVRCLDGASLLLRQASCVRYQLINVLTRPYGAVGQDLQHWDHELLPGAVDPGI